MTTLPPKRPWTIGSVLFPAGLGTLVYYCWRLFASSNDRTAVTEGLRVAMAVTPGEIEELRGANPRFSAEVFQRVAAAVIDAHGGSGSCTYRQFVAHVEPPLAHRCSHGLD